MTSNELLMQVAWLPDACILSDSEMGRCSEWRDRLSQRGERYILDIPSNTKIRIDGISGLDEKPVKAMGWMRSRPKSAWPRVQTREGSQVPTPFAVYRVNVETKRRNKTIRAETLNVPHPIDNPDDLKIALTNFPPETSIEELAQFATRRGTIEDCFERGKGECGLGQYEVRSWVGWHHHMTMAILAA